MTNNNEKITVDKSVIDLLKKMGERHPDDKELQDFLQYALGPDNDPNSTNEDTYIRRVKVSAETMNAAQMLISAGITSPTVIHEQTGIPMEALVGMRIEVPVHNYVIPVTSMSVGLVSVQGVSPEDAMTMLAHHEKDINLSEILSEDEPVLGIADDLELIETLTKFAEEGLIDDITDSGLISPVVKANNTLKGPSN